jgi:Protein of unknown function (DUF3592)
MKVSPVLIGGIVLLFSSIFIFLCAHGVYRDIQFRQYGAKSMATIENLSKTSGGAGHGGITFKAKYTFATPSGVETVEVPISSASYYSLQSAQQVSVLYLPGVPGESRLDDQIDANWQLYNHASALALGLFIAATGCFVMRTGQKKRRKMR